MPINESNFNRAINEIREFMNTIAEEIKRNEGQEEESTDYETMVFFSSQEYGSLTITGDGVKKYNTVLRTLIDAVILKGEEHISEKSIESLLQTAILKSIDYTEKQEGTPFKQRLTQSLSDLKTQLNKAPTDWEMLLLVLGIHNPSLPFEAGKILFLPGDSEQIKSIIERLSSLEMKDAEGKKNLIHFAEKLALENYLQNSIAVVKIKAVDAEAAKRLAIGELRLHLDVLNHFSDIMFSLKTRIYLPGDAYQTKDLTIGFNLSEGRTGCNLNTAITGPASSYSFAEEHIGQAAKAGFSQVLEMLKELNRNSFQKKVLAAFQWSGRAETEEEPERVFLMYAIALESLLLGGKNKTDVTYKVSTRCAHLLGKNLEAKKRIRKQMNDLYGVRSSIVHAGSFEVTPSDLGTLRAYTKGALAIIVTDERFASMTEEQDLAKWFEDRVLE